MNNKGNKQEIRVSRNAVFSVAAGRAGRIIVIAILSAIVLYLCFAAMILRIIPTDNMGGVLVKNDTFLGDIAPKGSVVLINNSEKQGDGVLDHLQQSVLLAHGVSKVEILAGPYGKISWAEPGVMSVDGNPVSVLVPAEPQAEFLQNQYVGKCLAGACKKGSGFIFSKNHIYGVPLGGK